MGSFAKVEMFLSGSSCQTKLFCVRADIMTKFGGEVPVGHRRDSKKLSIARGWNWEEHDDSLRVVSCKIGTTSHSGFLGLLGVLFFGGVGGTTYHCPRDSGTLRLS